MQLGQRRCLSVAGKRIDETIAAEMLRAVEPMAIEAAELAERSEDEPSRHRILSSNSSRRAMRRLSPNAATPPATPTTA